MANTCIGFMLIDAPHSALNNAGMETGARTDNTVAVKVIKKDWRSIYPYVSSQALRYWWRGALQDRFGWRTSPIDRDKKTAFTKADPITYPDDDLFGYMRAEKPDTLTRVSPFKCSPLVSVTPVDLTTDFGVMSRHEGDPVPYEHQFYATTLKGVFSLDLDWAGRFLSVKRSGYQNLTEKTRKQWTEEGMEVEDGVVALAPKERGKRVAEWLSALPYLAGGAKQTGHLTDVSPSFVVLTALSCGNHILMNVVNEHNEKMHLNLAALSQALEDYADDVLAPVWIGRRAGFCDEWEEEIHKFIEDMGFKHDIRYGSVMSVTQECAKWLREYYSLD